MHMMDAAAACRSPSNVASILCTEVIREFRGAVRFVERHGSLSQRNRHCLKKACDTLTLWASGYGIPEGDLDEALATSWVLERSMLELLISVSNLLLHKLIPLLDQGGIEDANLFALRRAVSDASGVLLKGLRHHRSEEVPSDDESDSGSDSTGSNSSDLETVLQDIDLSVQCLLDLGPLINGHVKDCKTIEVPRPGDAIATFKPYQTFTNILSYRYPKAHKDLLDRLARANLERFLRTHQLRTESVDDGKITDSGASSTDFSDSGVGLSNHTGTSYAATIMSYRQKDSHSVKIPPLSEAAKQGVPFECLACGGKVRFRENSIWKKHLFMDLRPWVCHDISCARGSASFLNRQEWVDHLARDHDVNKETLISTCPCPLCQETIQGSKFDLIEHMAVHLEEISLSALPATVDSDEDAFGEEAQGSGRATAEAWDSFRSDIHTDAFNYTVQHPSNQSLEDGGVLEGQTTLLPRGFKNMTLSTMNLGKLRPFHVCYLCSPPKAFTRMDNLHRHQKRHGEPKYPCDYPVCDKRFHRQDLLEQHQLQHETHK